MNSPHTTKPNQVPNINIIIIQCLHILSTINTIVKPRLSSQSLSFSLRKPFSFISASVFKHYIGLDSWRRFCFCLWFNDRKGKFNLTTTPFFFSFQASLALLNCLPLTTMAVLLHGFEDSHGLQWMLQESKKSPSQYKRVGDPFDRAKAVQGKCLWKVQPPRCSNQDKEEDQPQSRDIGDSRV
ncbi:uncharacterized protein LOC111008982 isoform X2 [Momordica charantia]|uniref:Uncharacterized protein LOC111008982 isoform X2 n=1 Tax=Momordica charantia TaxID=3673 RepID=A0A6J1C6Z6_MOMCH|nr:uncharacterized protein LOC111008982 isoform X2 [Momordica charantia]